MGWTVRPTTTLPLVLIKRLHPLHNVLPYITLHTAPMSFEACPYPCTLEPLTSDTLTPSLPHPSSPDAHTNVVYSIPIMYINKCMLYWVQMWDLQSGGNTPNWPPKKSAVLLFYFYYTDFFYYSIHIVLISSILLLFYWILLLFFYYSTDFFYSSIILLISSIILLLFY